VLQCVAVCCGVLQCVAVCGSVLQCVTVCYSAVQFVVVYCSVLQRVSVCYSVLQCVAVCCSVLQCVTTGSQTILFMKEVFSRIETRLSGEAHCDTLQHTATHCMSPHHTAIYMHIFVMSSEAVLGHVGRALVSFTRGICMLIVHMFTGASS